MPDYYHAEDMVKICHLAAGSKNAGPRSCARLPDELNKAHLVARYGFIAGNLLLWVNRTRSRHNLATLAEIAPEHLFDDIGVTRSMVEREANRWFWQEMGLT